MSPAPPPMDALWRLWWEGPLGDLAVPPTENIITRRIGRRYGVAPTWLSTGPGWHDGTNQASMSLRGDADRGEVARLLDGIGWDVVSWQAAPDEVFVRAAWRQEPAVSGL